MPTSLQISHALDEMNKVKWGVDFSKYKAVFSGATKEVYEFEKDVHFGGRVQSHNRKPKRTGKRLGGIRRPFSIDRARQRIRRLISCNTSKMDIFCTFTFADRTMKDIKTANRHWTLFVKRLNTYLKFKVKYVAVVEFQPRSGVIHYHAVFFNLPYIPNDQFAKIWSHGFIKMNAIKNIRNIGAYVSKYLQKGVVDARLFNEKVYFASRGLVKPFITRLPPLDIDLSSFSSEIGQTAKYELLKVSEYYSRWTGKIIYKIYNLITT